jgi:hypothetical protein
MIRGPEDLLEDLGLEADAAPPPVLAPMELAALRALSGPTLPEHVARELGVGLGDALGVLVGLELRGLVRGVGGRFEPTLAAVPALAASQHAASDGPPAAGAEERPPRGVGVT